MLARADSGGDRPILRQGAYVVPYALVNLRRYPALGDERLEQHPGRLKSHPHRLHQEALLLPCCGDHLVGLRRVQQGIDQIAADRSSQFTQQELGFDPSKEAWALVILVNGIFIFIALRGADQVVPSYVTEER